MTPLVKAWTQAQALDIVPISETETVLAIGGPYPETRAGWLHMVRDLDPLAADWLDYAFEAHRITARIHSTATTGFAACLHPEARFLSRRPEFVTCRVCRYVLDIENAPPLPSIFEMGDVVGNAGPVEVWG